MTRKTSRLPTMTAILAATTGIAATDLGAGTEVGGHTGFLGAPVSTPDPYRDVTRVCRSVLCGHDINATTA